MNRLAIMPTTRTTNLGKLIDHLSDASDGRTRDSNGDPTEYGSVLELLANPAIRPTPLAEVLHNIAKQDELGLRIGHRAVIDYRKENGIA